FLRWPRAKRIAKESMQARKRLRLGQLTEGFDGLEAETTSPAECIASAENVQQRIDSLLDAVVSYQSDGHLGELRIAGMDRLVQERAGNGGLQGDQRLDCFQPNAKVRMMRAASDLRQGVAIVHPAEKQDHVPHDVPARIGKETRRLRDDDAAQQRG